MMRTSLPPPLLVSSSEIVDSSSHRDNMYPRLLSTRAPMLVLMALTLLLLVLTVINLVLLTSLTRSSSQDLQDNGHKASFAVYGKNIDSGYLKHVYNVLEAAGYIRVDLEDKWNLLWAHDYPFSKLKSRLSRLGRSQKVNKWPGSGYVTNKVNLATSNISTVPKAFKIPEDLSELRTYAASHPSVLFVQKNKNHRGINIRTMDELDLRANKSFVQTFVANPLLIDGYKFDIGVYTIVTSVQPLRIYMVEHDLLLRFCPKKYQPFDRHDRDQYVVHDDYRPTWEVPSLSKLYSEGLGFSFRVVLDEHLRSLDKSAPDRIWSQVEAVIREVYLTKQAKLVKALKSFSTPDSLNFFELVRFDFVIDELFKVHLMEVNMSPNLSSKHFPPNRVLYEQVLYTVFRIAALIPAEHATDVDVARADKDLHVFPRHCQHHECVSDCHLRRCRLCRHCLDSETRAHLSAAYDEHLNRHNAIRILPRPVNMSVAELVLKELEDAGEHEVVFHDELFDKRHQLTKADAKMADWMTGKCLLDRNWCQV